MIRVSPSYTVAIRVVIDESVNTMTLVEVVGEMGAVLTALDIVKSDAQGMHLDITADCHDSEHRRQLVAALREVPGVTVKSVADSTFLAHMGGKLEVKSKIPVKNRRDLSRVYTPGVARVCTSIADTPDKAYLLTMKANTVAVVSDGSAVLGLGDIGPAAALPVMEGKAVLFKEFANVDAWPVVLDTNDVDEIVNIVKAMAPGYGGINLEDIAAPRCFEIEERLRAELDIPVFHDDQHGTAIVVLAALLNALKVVGKDISKIRIAVAGVGAAGSAIIKLLMAQGATDIVGYGRTGALHAGDVEGMHPSRRWLAEHTNPRGVTGDLRSGIKDADVFIGVSAGNLLDPEDIATMADDAIVFALSNPTPEVDPQGASKYAKVIATGRSDYPNQINNVLAFPGLFRGLLDARVSEITTEVLRVSAVAIAGVVGDQELDANYIIPGVFDQRVAPAVAEAVRGAVKDLPTREIPVQEHMDF